MNLRKAIQRAIDDSDDWVLSVVYEKPDGTRSRRLISPYRIDQRFVWALCLCRADWRRFELRRLSDIRFVMAHTVLMPEKLEIILL